MKERKYLVVSVIYLFISFLVIFILPCGDDWDQSVSPLPNFGLGDFLPQLYYWRPLEKIFGLLVTLFPWIFPFFNHFVVVIFHALVAIIVNKIIKFYGVKDVVRFWSVVFILFAPTVMATLYSVDGIGQAGMTFFSILSLYVFITNVGFKRYFYWIIYAIVATLLKESGIVWLITTPLIAYSMEYQDFRKLVRFKNLLNLGKTLAVGSIIIALYFGIRMKLSVNDVFIQSESVYSLQFSFLNILKNIGLMFGCALTTIDTIALFNQPRNLTIAITTFFLGLPLLIYISHLYIKSLLNRSLLYKYIILTSITLFLIPAPYLLLGHASEMHSYTVFPMIVIIVSILFNDHYTNKKIVILCIFLFAASSIFVDAHKYICIYNTGMKGNRLAKKIEAQINQVPNKVLIIQYIKNEPGYSVYCQPTWMSFYNGYALKRLYNYKYPKTIINIYVKDQLFDKGKSVDKIIESYRDSVLDYIFVIKGDSIKVVDLVSQ